MTSFSGHSAKSAAAEIVEERIWEKVFRGSKRCRMAGDRNIIGHCGILTGVRGLGRRV